MDSQDGDERAAELETLEAIYPEISYPDRTKDPFTFDIELPVQPERAVTVRFPAPPTATVPTTSNAAVDQPGEQEAEIDSLQVSHLPSLRLRVTLPKGYPADVPPSAKITSDPPWLQGETVSRLEADVATLWEEMGRDMVAFAYVDHVRRAADDVFDAITPEGTLEVDAQHKLAVLDYDIKAKRAAFERETFDCGVCLDPKKGTKCHKMLDCGHIFCLQCLQDFYNDAITEGNIGVVRCLSPSCAKERADAAKAGNGKRSRKKPTTALSPSELLQIGLAEDAVKRYVALKYKTELESDKDTIYCPRQWCSGAARSKKHRKPEGLELTNASETEESEEEVEDGQTTKKKKKRAKFNRGDLLAVCEDCGFAFCSRCFLSWHGEFVICTPKRDAAELTEEEKASLEYVKLHTSPCPTCSAPAQKTHGCNHMICSRCESHFCYLCSAWLDPDNPYRHYNTQPGGKVTSCYMRLWELEGGDGEDVGNGFVGGQDPVRAAVAEAAVVMEEEFGEDDSSDEEEPAPVAAPPVAAQGQPVGNGEPVLAREGPLVLRLMGHPQQQPQPPPAPAPAAAPARGGRGRGRGAARGGRGGGAQRVNREAAAARIRGNRRQAGARRGGGIGALVGGEAAIDAVMEEQFGAGNGGGGLDAAQEQWVRNFVRMALIDAEDQVDDDSDEEMAIDFFD